MNGPDPRPDAYERPYLVKDDDPKPRERLKTVPGAPDEGDAHERPEPVPYDEAHHRRRNQVV